MEEIEINDIILNGGNGGDWTHPTPVVPVDKYDEPSIVELPDVSNAEFENANDTSSIADSQEEGVAVSYESKNTKKKVVAIVASIAILAGVVGLGAGLGTKKNGNVSAANSAVTLEDCLGLAEDQAADDADAFAISSVNVPVPTNEPTTWEPTTGEVLLEDTNPDTPEESEDGVEIKFSNDVMDYIDLGINGDGPERRDLRGVGSAAKKAAGLKDNAWAKKTRKLQCQDLLSKSSKSKTSKSTSSKSSKSTSSKSSKSKSSKITIKGTKTETFGNLFVYSVFNPECRAGFPPFPPLSIPDLPASDEWLDADPGGSDCPFYRDPFMINRSVGSESNFYFENIRHAPIGHGAVCGGPGGSSDVMDGGDVVAENDIEANTFFDGSTKFILEYFGDFTEGSAPFVADSEAGTGGNDLWDKPLGQLEDIKYDFYVKSCASGSYCPGNFYLNVYVRREAGFVLGNPGYDCNFSYLTTDGGEEGTWTTVDLRNILRQPSVRTFTTPDTPGNPLCDLLDGSRATTMQDYLDDYPDSVLTNQAFYTFAWNIGDINSPQEGLEGCYDNIQIKLKDEEYTRAYDFEPQKELTPPKPCMAGQTGFTKVDTSSSSKSTTVTRVDNLQVGDIIHGLDEFKSKNEACEIVSLTSAGDRTVYGNYTDDHFILSEEDPGTLVAHGEAGQTEDFTTVYQVLSTCPVVTDETGKESTFTICAKSLAVDGSLPWSSYLRIHATILGLVLETGVRTISSFYDIDKAREYLPTLCTSGLVCSESGDCDEFEAAFRIFVQEEIVPDKIDQVMAAFPSIGEASSKGSVSALISSGKSVR